MAAASAPEPTAFPQGTDDVFDLVDTPANVTCGNMFTCVVCKERDAAERIFCGRCGACVCCECATRMTKHSANPKECPGCRAAQGLGDQILRPGTASWRYISNVRDSIMEVCKGCNTTLPMTQRGVHIDSCPQLFPCIVCARPFLLPKDLLEHRCRSNGKFVTVQDDCANVTIDTSVDADIVFINPLKCHQTLHVIVEPNTSPGVRMTRVCIWGSSATLLDLVEIDTGAALFRQPRPVPQPEEGRVVPGPRFFLHAALSLVMEQHKKATIHVKFL